MLSETITSFLNQKKKTVTTNDISTTFDIFTTSKLYRLTNESYYFYEKCIRLKLNKNNNRFKLSFVKPKFN